MTPQEGLGVRERATPGAEGVRHAWLADPLLQTLEVLRLEDPAWRLVATYNGDLEVRAEPFDAIELDLALVWKGKA